MSLRRSVVGQESSKKGSHYWRDNPEIKSLSYDSDTYHYKHVLFRTYVLFIDKLMYAAHARSLVANSGLTDRTMFFKHVIAYPAYQLSA